MSIHKAFNLDEAVQGIRKNQKTSLAKTKELFTHKFNYKNLSDEDKKKKDDTWAAYSEAKSESAVTTLLLQMSTLAQRITDLKKSGDKDSLNNCLHLYKQKLEELQIYTGGEDGGNQLVELVAWDNGIDMKTLYDAAAEVQADDIVNTVSDNHDLRSGLLNPATAKTLSTPKPGSQIQSTLRTTKSSFNFSANYNDKTGRWEDKTRISGEGIHHKSESNGYGTYGLRYGLWSKNPVQPFWKASTGATNKPVVDRSNTPDSEEAPSPDSTRLDYQDNLKKQTAVDNVLSNLPKLLDNKATVRQRADAVKNLADVASTLPDFEQFMKSDNKINYISDNYMSNVLYSLSHKNKNLAQEYAPKILEAAMEKYGQQSKEEAVVSAQKLRRSLADFGITDDKAMDLMYRMSLKPLSQAQQKDLSARLKKGEGLSAFMTYYPDQIKSFVQDNPEVQNGIANYLSRPENEAMAKQMLPYITDAAAQQMGMQNSGWLQSLASGAADMFGMPAHAVIGMFKGGSDFFKEFLKTDTPYTNTSPLGEQAYERLLDGTRRAARVPAKQAQIESGMRNLQKVLPFHLEDSTARKISEIMNSRAASMGFQAIKGQLQQVLAGAVGSPEQAAGMLDALEKNFHGLFSGFQGGYDELIDLGTRGTHDRRSIEQFGIMAGRMQTIMPSVENKFMRAGNYRTALAGMMQEGFRPEFYITRRDEDMYRQATKLTESQRNRIGDEIEAAEMQKSVQNWEDLKKDPARLQKTMDEIKKSDYYKQNQERFSQPGVTDQDIYRAYENEYRIQKDKQTVLDALSGESPEQVQKSIEEIKTNGTAGAKRMTGNLMNQIGAFQMEDMIQKRAEVEADFRNVLSGVQDRTGFLQKLPGDDLAKSRQLIRMLGGATVSNDYATQAERAMNTITAGSMAGMDLERTVSLVSETGKIAQSLGLEGDAVQVAGNLAANLVASTATQYRSPADSQIDMAQVQAHAARNAASMLNSQNSRNLVFLMTEDFAEGSEMAKLKERVLKGEQLSPEELAKINTDALRRDYTGSTANFEANMSQAAYNQKLANLSNTEQKALNLNLTAAEQDRFRNKLSQGHFEEAFTNTINDSIYTGDKSELYDVRKQMLGKIGPKRTAELLSGTGDPMNEEERKLLGPELAKRVEAISGNIATGKNEEFRRNIETADANLAKTLSPDASINAINAAMVSPEEGEANRIANEVDIKKRLSQDFDVTTLEQFINSADSGESYMTRFGKAVKNKMAGGHQTQEQAIQALMKDHNGLRSMMFYAGRDALDAKSMFHNLGIDDEAAQEEFAKKAGFDSAEDMYTRLRNATPEEFDSMINRIAETEQGKNLETQLGEEVRKQYANAESPKTPSEQKAKVPVDKEAPSTTGSSSEAAKGSTTEKSKESAGSGSVSKETKSDTAKDRAPEASAVSPARPTSSDVDKCVDGDVVRVRVVNTDNRGPQIASTNPKGQTA